MLNNTVLKSFLSLINFLSFLIFIFVMSITIVPKTKFFRSVKYMIITKVLTINFIREHLLNSVSRRLIGLGVCCSSQLPITDVCCCESYHGGNRQFLIYKSKLNSCRDYNIYMVKLITFSICF